MEKLGYDINPDDEDFNLIILSLIYTLVKKVDALEKEIENGKT